MDDAYRAREAEAQAQTAAQTAALLERLDEEQKETAELLKSDPEALRLMCNATRSDATKKLYGCDALPPE